MSADPPTDPPTDGATDGARLGVRALRADLATMVRRAAAGQRTIVTIAGRSVAVLGPVQGSGPELGLDALVAAGLLQPPRRSGPAPATADPVPVWSGVRLDRALREVRG